MFNDLTSADCLERAQMHELLADSTADDDARKMHRAMAAGYRRKAEEMGSDPVRPSRDEGSVLEIPAPIA